MVMDTSQERSKQIELAKVQYWRRVGPEIAQYRREKNEQVEQDQRKERAMLG